jgi:hypothetical protein
MTWRRLSGSCEAFTTLLRHGWRRLKPSLLSEPLALLPAMPLPYQGSLRRLDAQMGSGSLGLRGAFMGLVREIRELPFSA